MELLYFMPYSKTESYQSFETENWKRKTYNRDNNVMYYVILLLYNVLNRIMLWNHEGFWNEYIGMICVIK